uniref:Serine/threonine protein kinase n=1 Tax=Solibacter usitatus (strain Ellin6076) TaxID=234267 RepID=Q01WI5_SOLUE
MPLTAGTKLGPYEIVGSLGAGGMGEVYRARDSRLGREVAIKVLHGETGLTGEGRRRFEQEARSASSLNHPNILTIYDFGQEGELPYIVSELVAGESLRNLMSKGTLPLRTLLDIAVQIADGLAAAHAAGITHRDLKPENILISAGRAKIVDFGLAKATAQPSEEGTTQTLFDALTSPGSIVGTIAYMSPEQAQGQPLDFRSDQFSFGTMLYEMVSGTRPFDCGDRIATLSAIVKEEPAALTGAQSPPPLRWIIQRCLAKEPSRRFASTAGLHEQLRDLRDHLPELSGTSAALSAAPSAAAPVPTKRQPLLAALSAAAALAAGFLLATISISKGARPQPYIYTPFATDAVDESQPAWSPDAQALAYVATVDDTPQVFTRSLKSPLAVQLTHSQRASISPFWSPDGSRVYYWSQGSLWSVGAAGGAPQLVIQDVATPRGPAAAISPDGKTFAFFRHDGPQFAVFLQSGTEKAVAYKRRPFPGSFRFFDGVSFSADGENLLVTVIETIDVKRGVEAWILPLPDGAPRKLAAPWPPAARPRTMVWAPDGRRSILSMEPAPGSWAHLYAIDTVTAALQPLTGGTGEEREPAVSPDGRRIAFTSGAEDTDLIEIALDGTKTKTLLATSRPEYSGAWSPSGLQYVYVTSAPDGPAIWMRSLAEGWARPFEEGSAEGYLDLSQPRYSPDGQRIAYVRTGARHAVYVSSTAGGPAVPLERESADQHTPAWSPDGNWIAYTRFVGQNWEITKAPSGGGGQPVRLGIGGDSSGWMEWSPTGAWIGVRDASGLQLVSPEGGAARHVHGPCAAFAFSKDGNTLLVVRRSKDQHWELASLGVADGVERKSVTLNLPRSRNIRDISLHPDGTRFMASVGVTSRDIWILDGFDGSR